MTEYYIALEDVIKQKSKTKKRHKQVAM